MDRFLLDRVREDTPQMNPDIANGLAVKHIPFALQYIDSVFRSISKDFPPGLTYVNCRKCTPFEEFYDEPRKKNNKRVVDIARSDISLVRFNFRYEGKDLPPKYIYLPFVGEAGSIVLGGSRFFISPVLSDIILSYEDDNIFVRLLRDKFTIRRIKHNFAIDGVRETESVAWSLIYHVNKDQRKQKKVSNAKTTLVHYLLCRYGFDEMFQRFGNCLPVIGTHAIIPENYPPNEWVICSTYSFSVGKATGSRIYHEPTKIKLAIRKKDFTPMVKSLVVGFFYTVDHFPYRISPEYVNSTRIWKTLMGLLLFGNELSEGRLHDDIDAHIRSLDEYVDTLTQPKFEMINLPCSDIYQFFAIAVEKLNEWIMQAPERTNSLYDKELSVLYDTFLPMTTAIFNFYFKLKTAAAKGLTEKEVVKLMDMYIKPKSIFYLTKQPTGVSNMSYSGDNKLLKITTVMVPQKNKNAGGNKGDDLESLSDKAKRLHVSFAEVGNFSNLPKSNPTGDSRVAPYLRLDPNGKVLQNPDRIHLLNEVSAMIKRN